MRQMIRAWKPALVATGVLALLAAGWAGSTGTAQTPEWHQWRGANRDGRSAETGLLQQWPASGPRQIWRATGAGEGYSSFSTSGGRLFTMGARGGTEYVMAFDLETGRKVWETPNGRRFRNDRGDGPRGTPTVDGDRLYALGGSGTLACLDAQTGRPVWAVDVLDRFGGYNPNWGLSESPLVLGDRVLVNAGGRSASIVALNKQNGSVLWASGDDPAAYSSAVTVRVGDVPTAVFFTARRALGVDVRDGRVLWGYERVANRTANIATPVVRGTRVFVSSDYGTGAALLDLVPRGNGVEAREVYFTRDMRNHHASSVLERDHLYGFSSTILTAMAFDTGTVAWRDRSVGKGSVIYADGRLYLFSENGVVGLAEATPDGYRERGRFRIAAGTLPTWSHPIIASGRLILRDQDALYAYDIGMPKE